MMQPIDNTTITIKSAVIAVVSLLTLTTTVVTVWFTAKNAVQSGFNEMKIEMADQRNEIKIIKMQVDEIKDKLNVTADQVEINTLTIKTVVDFIKPDGPQIKRERK